jgi:chromosome segregation ATPase
MNSIPNSQLPEATKRLAKFLWGDRKMERESEPLQATAAALNLDDETLIEQLIEQVLEGHPRAEQWRQWREALEERLEKLLELKAKGIVEYPNLDERIEELKRYIAVLREEEIITEFVEQQVRMVVGKAKLERMAGEVLDEG